jgi:hypothetical protein
MMLHLPDDSRRLARVNEDEKLFSSGLADGHASQSQKLMPDASVLRRDRRRKLM